MGDFTDARMSAGLTIQQTADWFEKSVRTVQRWENKSPYWTVRMLRLKAGYLDEVHPDLKDWRIIWGSRIMKNGWHSSISLGDLNYWAAYPGKSPVTRDEGTRTFGGATHQKQFGKEKTSKRQNSNAPRLRIITKPTV